MKDERNGGKLMANEPKSHPQILIVEDNSFINELIKLVFEKIINWRTTTVENGVSAVEAWDKGDFDVILMDLKLPLMDGIEATRRIREHEKRSGRKHTPIIAFTALVHKNYRQECAEAGFDDFIGKPTSLNKVIDTIKKHLPASLA
jgi:CheY-like chemotaxis protein